MMISRSRISVCKGGLIVTTSDGQTFEIQLSLEDRISLASQLLSHGIVELRTERAREALMSGLAAGDAYAGEEEEEAN